MAKSKAKPESKPPFVAEEPTPAWPRATHHPEMPLTEAEKDAIDWEIIKNDDENDSVNARAFLDKLKLKAKPKRPAKHATN